MNNTLYSLAALYIKTRRDTCMLVHASISLHW